MSTERIVNKIDTADDYIREMKKLQNQWEIATYFHCKTGKYGDAVNYLRTCLLNNGADEKMLKERHNHICMMVFCG